MAGAALLCPVVIANRSDRDLPAHRVLQEQAHVLDGVPTELAEKFRSVAVVVDAAKWEQFASVVGPAAVAADPATIERIQAADEFTDDVDGVGAPIKGPSLIVVGRQDSIVGFRDALRLLDRFPRSTFAVLDVAGHLLVSERPGVLATLVGDWLDRMGSQAHD
ncbi:MAG: alpha/beta hydrolase [Chloroflexota bacterium]